MITTDFIAPEMMRRTISVRSGDPEFKSGLTKGMYMTVIREALDLFAFESFFDPKYHDIDLDGSTLKFTLPKDIYSIKNLYVYNGTCSPEDSVYVYWKQGFNSAPDGQNYTAPRNEQVQLEDPFKPYGYGTSLTVGFTGVKWANVNDDGSGLVMMLSTSCMGYSKVRIEYYGTYGPFEEVPCIPRIMNDGVRDYGCREICRTIAVMNRDPFMLKVSDNYDEKFENKSTGTYWQVLQRVNQLSEWERKSFNEYLNKGMW